MSPRALRSERHRPSTTMFDRLEQIEARYEELTRALASPDIMQDSGKFQKTAKAHSEIAPLVEKYREYKDLTFNRACCRRSARISGSTLCETQERPRWLNETFSRYNAFIHTNSTLIAPQLSHCARGCCHLVDDRDATLVEYERARLASRAWTSETGERGRAGG